MHSHSLPSSTLKRHPDSHTDSVKSIEVVIARLPTGGLNLVFILSGDLGSLRIPEVTPAVRADGLWQHTCFEAFIKSEDTCAYREFNFSPAGHWQAYTFIGYRDGGPLETAANPQISRQLQPEELCLHATIQPEDLPAGKLFRLGFNAVIEATDGKLGYWALRHPPGKPDFHHPDTFALELEWP